MGDSDNPRHEPPINSREDSDDEEDDGTRPTGLDDHTPDGGTEETEEVNESSGGESGAGAAAAAGGATAGAAAATGGAAAEGAAGIPAPTQEELSSEDPDDCDESKPSEESDVPDPEQERGQSDEDPDREEDSDDTEQEEKEEDEQKAQIVVYSDPWDSVGWGIYPVRLQLKEEYGDQIQFEDQLVPIREFDFPEEMKQRWEKWAPRHGMPVDSDIWTDDPPESTELANRAFAAAREQGLPQAKRYMRRLKVAAVVGGINIEERDTLLEIAQNVGLDTDQLEENWDDVRVRSGVEEVDTPKTSIHIDGETITQPGLVTINDVKTPLKRAGLEADDPQPLSGFVDEHGPVALKEVRQVYGYDEREALKELQITEGVEPVKFGDSTFWVKV